MGKLNNLISRSFFKKNAQLNSDRGIVSFTFDDIPQSAAQFAADTLDINGAHGTFYIAPSLMLSGEGEMAPYADADEIRSLAERGHHIAAHSQSHIDVTGLNGAQLNLEVETCDQQLADLLGNPHISDFSFPFGCVNGTTKKSLQRHYRSMRSIFPGLNGKTTDLAALRAVSLYEESQNEESIKDWITQAIETKAWLIFYTHDVIDDHSPWGITPNLFRFAVEAAAQADVDVLSVAETIDQRIALPTTVTEG